MKLFPKYVPSVEEEKRDKADRARRIGSFLHQAGFYKKPVVVFMKKHPKTIVAFLGTIYSGCFYVPLDEEMPRHRIDLIFQTLQPGAIICDDTTALWCRNLITTARPICTMRSPPPL